MSDSIHTSTNSSQISTRRTLLWGAGAAGVAALWAFKKPFLLASSASSPKPVLPANVSVVEFGADGKPTGTVTVPRVVKTDAEWKQQLSPIAFEVTRQAGTERPYSGQGWDEHRIGLFRCVCCDLALFRSGTKFDSGTGWPSFWEPIAKENVLESSDSALGMERTAVSCRKCDAHLGHVFDDGPQPTGLRYCMNAASLHFVTLA